ncbi:NUDIX domain-containing protein [Actinomadura sp. 9N407]|uniref:NUDIX hydrolase n=1 Tax=Actinomadura sp. 9N407 TaxID=3375154 RepID=UPI00379E3779
MRADPGPAGDPGPIRAAGAVLWRDGAGPGEPEVALVHRPKYDDWSFPKGKVDSGEHVLRAVIREVEEEAGIVARLGRRLPSVTYPMADRTKRIDYWAAHCVAPSTEHSVPNGEVDRLDWLTVAEAEERLSYPHDVDLLREFAAGPSHTWPLVILRHGSAGEKGQWTEPDELRPLDGQGRAEAVTLSALLRAYGPSRPISSATARCLDTVLPFARAMDATVTTDAAFTVGETDAERACDRLLELADGGVPAIICTHGEVVAELITGLCRRLGEKVPDEPSLRKGSFWVAHLSAAESGALTIAALERHCP